MRYKIKKTIKTLAFATVMIVYVYAAVAVKTSKSYKKNKGGCCV